MTYQQNVRTGRVIKHAKDFFIAGLIYGALSITCFAFNLSVLGGVLFGASIVAWASSYLTQNLVVKPK